jgi:S1-C subfamily serine protease
MLNYIVTAAHVVAGDSQPKIEFFTKRNVSVLAEVLGVEGGDELRGLALLIVRGRENLPSGLAPLPLAASARMSGGEEVVIIGFPRGAGPWAVIRGNVVSRRGRDIDLAAAVDEGNSGGPIIQNGRAVGLIAGVGQSFGRGVTAMSIHDFLEGFGITAQEEAPPKSVEAPLEPSAPSKPDEPLALKKPAITEKPAVPAKPEIIGKDGAPLILIPAG